MAIQKKMMLGGLSGGSLLGIYTLYVYPLSWSIEPLKHNHSLVQEVSSRFGGFDELLDRKSSDDRRTPGPPDPPGPTFRPPLTALHQRALTSETPVAAVAEDKPVPDESKKDETRASTKGPTEPPPHRPTEAEPPPPRPTEAEPPPPRPTEPPFIGDAYMSNDVPSQTACPDGIRSRVSKTEFGEKFLQRIPVLQWAKHVTREQHQRLSRYPGAHGWGGLDYKTLEETLSVLNSSANWQMLDDWRDRGNNSQCTRCAVVGNGGILKDSQKGKEIDGHHYVFRTNGVVIKGFEQDVGSRTTHYTFSTNTLMNSMRSYAGAGYKGPPVSKETRYVFLPDHDRDYLLMKAAATHAPVERGPERGKDPSKYFGEDVTTEKLKMYNPDFIRYLRNRFLRSNALKTKYKDIYRPSTGAVMLLAALHACDKVSAYGFMTPDYKNYSDHYYDSSYHAVGFYINHDLRMEMTLWQQLHQAGLIRLYMRE